MQWDIEFTVPFPRIPAGKHKGSLCTMNQMPYYYRYQITKIKQEFKSLLQEWYIQPNNGNKYREADIHFTIQRNNMKKLDSDAQCLMTKYIIDSLVDQDWLLDDDRTKITLEPTQLGVGELETAILVQVNFKGEIDDT
jgi:hypothetical protein